MNIKVVVVGKLDTNCYILSKNNSVLIIDPGDDAEKIISNIDKSMDVVGIIITHSHFDHIGAVSPLLNKYNVPVYDKTNLKEGINSVSSFSFEVIYTPGHLDDAIVLYFRENDVMFTGDFIFKNSIGRTDLPGGNVADMKKSILKILKYPENIRILPGHYASTTMQEEKKNLEFFYSHI